MSAIPGEEVAFGIFDRSASVPSFHVLRPDGALESDVAIFGRLWRTLSGWRWLGSSCLAAYLIRSGSSPTLERGSSSGAE